MPTCGRYANFKRSAANGAQHSPACVTGRGRNLSSTEDETVMVYGSRLQPCPAARRSRPISYSGPQQGRHHFKIFKPLADGRLMLPPAFMKHVGHARRRGDLLLLNSHQIEPTRSPLIPAKAGKSRSFLRSVPAFAGTSGSQRSASNLREVLAFEVGRLGYARKQHRRLQLAGHRP